MLAFSAAAILRQMLILIRKCFVLMLTVSRRFGLALAASFCTALFYADSAAQAQFSFTDDFNRTTLGSDYTVAATTGYDFSLDGSQLLLSKASGQTTDGITLTTNFLVTGDFTATVTVTRQGGIGSGSAGLYARDEPNRLASVYFVNANLVRGNHFQPSRSSIPVNDTSLTATFRIRRVGDTVFDEYSSDATGNVFTIINSMSGVGLTIPTALQLFLLEEQGNASAKQASFDNFSITSQGVQVQSVVAAEPSSLGLIGMATVTTMTTLPFVRLAGRLRRKPRKE